MDLQAANVCNCWTWPFLKIVDLVAQRHTFFSSFVLHISSLFLSHLSSLAQWPSHPNFIWAIRSTTSMTLNPCRTTSFGVLLLKSTSSIKPFSLGAQRLAIFFLCASVLAACVDQEYTLFDVILCKNSTLLCRIKKPRCNYHNFEILKHRKSNQKH